MPIEGVGHRSDRSRMASECGRTLMERSLRTLLVTILSVSLVAYPRPARADEPGWEEEPNQRAGERLNR